jgi:hypothetical protein
MLVATKGIVTIEDRRRQKGETSVPIQQNTKETKVFQEQEED